ncbi:hypothetical protein QOT17_014926 [Balamuthia mandrillaris]
MEGEQGKAVRCSTAIALRRSNAIRAHLQGGCFPAADMSPALHPSAVKAKTAKQKKTSKQKEKDSLRLRLKASTKEEETLAGRLRRLSKNATKEVAQISKEEWGEAKEAAVVALLEEAVQGRPLWSKGQSKAWAKRVVQRVLIKTGVKLVALKLKQVHVLAPLAAEAAGIYLDRSMQALPPFEGTDCLRVGARLLLPVLVKRASGSATGLIRVATMYVVAELLVDKLDRDNAKRWAELEKNGDTDLMDAL